MRESSGRRHSRATGALVVVLEATISQIAELADHRPQVRGRRPRSFGDTGFDPRCPGASKRSGRPSSGQDRRRAVDRVGLFAAGEDEGKIVGASPGRARGYKPSRTSPLRVIQSCLSRAPLTLSAARSNRRSSRNDAAPIRTILHVGLLVKLQSNDSTGAWSAKENRSLPRRCRYHGVRATLPLELRAAQRLSAHLRGRWRCGSRPRAGGPRPSARATRRGSSRAGSCARAGPRGAKSWPRGDPAGRGRRAANTSARPSENIA